MSNPIPSPMGEAPESTVFDPDVADDGNRRKMLMLGSVGVAVLIVVVGAYFLFFKSSGSSDNFASVPSAVHHSTVAKAGAAKGATAKATPTASPQVVPTTAAPSVYRDPFEPIYPSAAPTTQAATATTGTTTVSGTATQ